MLDHAVVEQNVRVTELPEDVSRLKAILPRDLHPFEELVLS